MPVRLTLRPAPEEMFTIRPKPRRFIERAAARVQFIVVRRFASTTASHASSVELVDRDVGLPDHPAGHVHQDVDVADAGEELLDRGTDGEVDVVLVDAVDRRARRREAVGDRAADALRGAGDDGDHPVQLAHAVVLRRGRPVSSASDRRREAEAGPEGPHDVHRLLPLPHPLQPVVAEPLEDRLDQALDEHQEGGEGVEGGAVDRDRQHDVGVVGRRGQPVVGDDDDGRRPAAWRARPTRLAGSS